jgi:Tat protein translocase TatB subunit
MFGIGYQEMFIILVVALVVFGPSRMPELAGQVGRWVRDFRRMSSDLTGEFEKTFAEVDEVKKSFTREMKSIQDEVEGVGKSTRGDLKKSGAKSAAKPLGAGAKAASSSTANKPALARANAAAKRAEKNGAAGKAAALNGHSLATKADPLADVSFFELDLLSVKSSSISSSNGEADDALNRVRRRRAAATYGKRAIA